jgi:uncharacterized membrane-anchored protein
MQEHPLRRTLSDELHARAFHDFDGAGRVIRFVFLVGNDDRAAVSYINEFMVKNRLPALDGGTNFCRHEMAGYALRIERHTEFLTISFLQSGLKVASGLATNAFDEGLLAHMPFAWARQTPAPLFHAIWVEVGGKPPRRLSQQTMIEHLQSRAVASNNFSDLAAQVHFAFDIDNSGFSRVVIFNSAIVASRMGRIVQRVVEIETYRLLALLGLSTVKTFSGRLGAAEDLVSNLTNDLAEQIKLPDGQVQTLLSILSTQAAEVEEIYSQTSYRLSATTAYLKILNARLDGMRLARLSGFQGVRGFLDRRMAPAMQSCSAFSERLSSLSRRISRAGQLLRTQTELIIQRQNRDLLQSMNERAKHQLRLQQTVERLSIAAVTYYGVGLVGYVAATLPIDRWGMSLTYIKAGAVPVIAFLVWLAIRQVRETASSPEKSD